FDVYVHDQQGDQLQVSEIDWTKDSGTWNNAPKGWVPASYLTVYSSPTEGKQHLLSSALSSAASYSSQWAQVIDDMKTESWIENGKKVTACDASATMDLYSVDYSTSYLQFLAPKEFFDHLVLQTRIFREKYRKSYQKLYAHHVCRTALD